MNIIEFECRCRKYDYEEYLDEFYKNYTNDESKSESNDEKLKYINSNMGLSDYLRIRKIIKKTKVRGDEFISQIFKYTTDITTDEFEDLEFFACDSNCEKYGCGKVCQMANYNFDMKIGHYFSNDETLNWTHFGWNLYKNDNKENLPSLPKDLEKLIKGKLKR